MKPVQTTPATGYYRTAYMDDALEAEWPESGAAWRVVDSWSCWGLFEFPTPDAATPIRLLGHDGGEPEDKILVRDFDWIAAELEELRVKLEKHEEEAKAQAQRYTSLLADIRAELPGWSGWDGTGPERA